MQQLSVGDGRGDAGAAPVPIVRATGTVVFRADAERLTGLKFNPAYFRLTYVEI
jgi:hypothetical protein